MYIPVPQLPDTQVKMNTGFRPLVVLVIRHWIACGIADADKITLAIKPNTSNALINTSYDAFINSTPMKPSKGQMVKAPINPSIQFIIDLTLRQYSSNVTETINTPTLETKDIKPKNPK